MTQQYYYGLDNDIHDESDIVHNIYTTQHDYRPQFKIQSDTPLKNDEITLGIELEFNTQGSREYAVSENIKHFNTECLVMYGKSDGSVRSGVELVSMPMTLEYIMSREEDFKALVESPTLFVTDDCGFHIHMSSKRMRDNMVASRKLLTHNTAVLSHFLLSNANRYCFGQLDQYSTIRNLVPPELSKLTYSQYVNSVKGGKESIKIVDKDTQKSYHEVVENNRYQAVNFSNNSTLEYRMWGGTKSWTDYKFYLITTELMARACAGSTLMPPTQLSGTEDFLRFIEANIALNDKHNATFIWYHEEVKARLIAYSNRLRYLEDNLKKGRVKTFLNRKDSNSDYRRRDVHFVVVPSSTIRVGDIILHKDVMQRVYFDDEDFRWGSMLRETQTVISITTHRGVDTVHYATRVNDLYIGKTLRQVVEKEFIVCRPVYIHDEMIKKYDPMIGLLTPRNKGGYSKYLTIVERKRILRERDEQSRNIQNERVFRNIVRMAEQPWNTQIAGGMRTQ